MSDVFECPACQLIVPVYVEEPAEWRCPRCGTVFVLTVNSDKQVEVTA